MMGPDAAPAGGDKRSHPRSGGAGAPPGGTRTSCEELADGAKPLALPDARTELMLRKGSAHWVLREGQQPPEARPGCWKTPLWRAERRGHLRKEMLTHGNMERPLARHTLDYSREAK